MVVVAVTLGFIIGGGPSLLTQRGHEELLGEQLSASTKELTTTTTAAAPRRSKAPRSTSSSPAPSTPSSAPTSTTTSTVAARAPKDVGVRVYNGSTKAGQAVVVGDRLKAAGYNVLAPGPSPRDPLATSVIHYVEGYAAEAAALAATLGLAATATAPMPTPPPVAAVGPASLVLIVAGDLVGSA